MAQSITSPPRKQTDLILLATRMYDNEGFTMTPTRGKAAYRPGWQTERLTLDELAQIITDSRQPLNLGVLLGEPSRWLIDIDLDHPVALELADQYLPPTGAIFGRKSKLRSHRLYYVTSPIATIQHCLPADADGKKAMSVELRSTGCQTVFPPSRHPSGEVIEWSDTDDLAEIDPAELADAGGVLYV